MYRRRRDAASAARRFPAVNPFDSARLAATELRAALRADLRGYELATAACQQLDVALRRVNPAFPLLHGADATINVRSRWALIRDDIADEPAAFLVAHELGHLRLHPHARGTLEVSMADVVEAYGALERRELQANVFAREFLLPRGAARQRFLQQHESASYMARSLGIPVELVRLQLYDALLQPQAPVSSKSYSLPARPTAAQEPAVNSDEPVTLVEAGPGTGKTTTLLLRLRRLLAAGARPESIVILTFSNKAARELLERARAGEIAGADRVWIGTFHSFGLEFLRKFHHEANLDARFPVLDKIASISLLEAFDPLSNPYPGLRDAFDAIRRAKDELIDARQAGSPIFSFYEAALAGRRCVDFADLLCKPVALMRTGHAAVDAWLRNFQHVMVDEYQDVNRASALFVKELSRHARTLWVVGDANQAIYAFMGASSRNLEGFRDDYPAARVLPLELNHRSSREIVDLFTAVARDNPAGRPVVALRSERGPAGHGPLVSVANNFDEQMDSLARRIRELEGSGIPFAEQAVLTFRNSDAADFAQALEARGIPVLFLGGIFERPEIKDLICLLQLAIDDAGVNLVRRWAFPALRLSPEGADAIILAARSQSRAWREVRPHGLSTADEAALGKLRQLCESIGEDTRPWEALSAILLEDGSLLRELATRGHASATNALMAIWHFVHSCRDPDATGPGAGIRRLTQNIRDRIRMNEDRAMRASPPEAESMNSVRIHTAHGSKGLEFDAVHFIKATRKIYDDPANRNERHNLLYVSISRARRHLTIYRLSDEQLPSSLEGRLPEEPASTRTTSAVARVVPEHVRKTVALDSYLEFVRCPHRHHIARRTNASVDDELKPFGMINQLASRRLRSMLRGESSFGLNGDAGIEERVAGRLNHAQRFLQDGGERGTRHVLNLGPLGIELHPEQSFVDGDVTRLRLIRNRSSSSMGNSMRQPLAALLESHHRNGGGRYSIELASIVDGETQTVGKVTAATREKYEDLTYRMLSGDSAPTPDREEHCHTCPYLFPCTGFSRRPD
jgi:superfamily I DNA/RNA helicase